MKIRGNTVGTTMPRPDWNQTDPNKADYIRNKPDVGGHMGNKKNPHGVTAAQVGAAPASHTSDKNNPHGVTAAQVGALPTSGGTIEGDLGIGTQTSTSNYDLYIRRTIDSILKSCRMYWTDNGALRVQYASDGTVYNYMSLESGRTKFAKPVTLDSGGTSSSTDLVNAPNNALITKLNNTSYNQLYYKASANGAVYATEANGAIKFGTLPVAQGGTDATDAATALANLGGVPRDGWKSLWTNASTASIFDSQQIALNSAASNYKYLAIDCRHSANYGYTQTIFIRDNQVGCCIFPAGVIFVDGTDLAETYRYFRREGNYLYCGLGYHNNVQHGQGCIPVKVYGIPW